MYSIKNININIIYKYLYIYFYNIDNRPDFFYLFLCDLEAIVNIE